MIGCRRPGCLVVGLSLLAVAFGAATLWIHPGFAIPTALCFVAAIAFAGRGD